MTFLNFSLEDSSHQTRGAAFTPATSKYLKHWRANTDSQKSRNTQHTRLKILHGGFEFSEGASAKWIYNDEIDKF
jgi:hypothetical protein